MMGKYVLILALCLIVTWCVETAVSAPDPLFDEAHCHVQVTVDEIVEWEGDEFANPLAPINITNQSDKPTDSESYTLWLNGNVILTADKEEDGDALLKSGTDTLITKYKLGFDGNGAAASGPTDVGTSNDYVLYKDFLGAGVPIIHVNTDGNVEITLFVEASNSTAGHGKVSDAGVYNAVQTLTATWQ